MDPIVFITHSRVRDGQLGALRAFLADGVPGIERDKPRTLAFLPYVDDAGAEVTIVHVFADAPSMAVHFQGLRERMAGAAPHIETLRVTPEFATGYLRLGR